MACLDHQVGADLTTEIALRLKKPLAGFDHHPHSPATGRPPTSRSGTSGARPCPTHFASLGSCLERFSLRSGEDSSRFDRGLDPHLASIASRPWHRLHGHEPTPHCHPPRGGSNHTRRWFFLPCTRVEQLTKVGRKWAKPRGRAGPRNRVALAAKYGTKLRSLRFSATRNVRRS